MSRRQLTIEVRPENDISVVALAGAIDASNVADFQQSLNELCDRPSPKILLDCANLTYVNSTSFGLFFKYHRTCKRKQGRFAMCALRSKVHNIIRILGLDKFLDIYPDVNSALLQLRKPLES